MIKLITDSAADIPKEEREELGITVMPIPITVDGVTYRESVDFTSEEYYQMLANSKSIPTHAQVTMMEYMDAFVKAIKGGASTIICVTITSKGSGIYDAACLAKKTLFEEEELLTKDITIDVVDGKAYTYVYGHAVVAAARAAKSGKSREEVLEVLQSSLESYYCAATIFDLTYAKKSGRITSVAAFVGEVMGFKPMMIFRNGEFVSNGKVRGDIRAIEELAKRYAEVSAEDGRPYYILTADNMEGAQQLKKLIGKHTKNKFGGFYRIGASVTTNAGPTVLAFLAPCERRVLKD